MSDVIRNEIIKLAIQLQTPNLKLPNLAPAVNQQNELTKATEKAATVNQAAADATSTAAKATAATTAAAAAAAPVKQLLSDGDAKLAESATKATVAIEAESTAMQIARMDAEAAAQGTLKFHTEQLKLESAQNRLIA